MATPTQRSGSDSTANPAPFSYAQAAKGLSSTRVSVTTDSKPSSGALTPSKDANTGSAAEQPTVQPNSITSWADDVETSASHSEKQSSRRDRSHGPQARSKTASAQLPAPNSSISSPDLGASSSSTVTKDDDVSSLQNTSSESTWENKSQASTSVEKAAEPTEKTADKVDSKNLEKSSFKLLHDAPVPTVNFWKQRAEEAKTKVPKTGASHAAPVVTGKPLNGSVSSAQGASTQKTKSAQEGDATVVKDKAAFSENASRGPEEEKDKPSQPRKESRLDLDFDKTKKGTKGRPAEKDSKPTSNAFTLPPVRDQESWPTPLGVVDEDKKKAQSKGDKVDKERKESTTSRAHGKHEWVTVPYTPTVVFNTPLPNTAASRRGGRAGGRGGATNSHRGSGNGVNGTGASEKDASALQNLSNGDQPRRGRFEGPRDGSPVKERRTTSAGSTTAKETKTSGLPTDKSVKATPDPANEAFSTKASVLTESASGAQVPNQSSTAPRQFPSSRPYKGKKGDAPYLGDKRKDWDSVSPTKEVSGSSDRIGSGISPSEGGENGERRTSTFQEGHSGQIKPSSNDRRYGSFPRERPRGGARGRGNFQNGHQYSNGHTSQLQNPTSFPLQSPTGTFYPDPSQNFSAAPPHNRNNRGPRSQSITGENMYSRFAGYPNNGPSMMPPLQTVVPGMYDYQPMQPMSAMPYNPYGMENSMLFSMVLTQLEYYFSVENLCKDIFLRKHMDSQGFVFLPVVAEFNRVKHLTTDLDLIKLACYQSRVIEFRVGPDDKDRLRRREGWEQWVLGVDERDSSAQNEGPEELHVPPVPHPNGFQQGGMSRYHEMAAASPAGHAPFHDFYPSANGFQPSGIQPSASPGDNVANGLHPEGMNGIAPMNGHAAGEPDSFSDEQVETLSVIVRRQESSQQSLVPPPAPERTFSNGSVDSKSGILDEGLKLNGTLQGDNSSASSSSGLPVRLYWVKGKDGPVDSLPTDSTYEAYTELRSKALEQRDNSTSGSCPYDMDVLYQFWSHFLIRNFNTRMYNEFRHLALDDARNTSTVGRQSLIKFYVESMLSSQVIRERVARHFVALVQQEVEHIDSHVQRDLEHSGQRPAFEQLRSTLRNSTLDPRNRKRIVGFLDTELKASLEL